MRLPKTPPAGLPALFAQAETPEEIRAITERLSSPQMREFVRMANHNYLHWDKLRYYERPDGVSAEEAWAAVSTSRMLSFRTLPIAFNGADFRLKFWSPPRHQELLHNIDQEAGGVIGGRASALADDEERYLFNSLMEEAIASSQLEGATTTRDVAKKMLRTKRKPKDRAEQMIVNNYRAILEIRDLMDQRLSPEIICHIQDVVTHNTLDDPSASGRFRTPNDKSVVVEDVATGTVIHEPPHAHSVQWRVEELCEFANTRHEEFIHPVIRAIALHFAIGYIHPFVDGNGRTARALFYWQMLKSGYWIFEYLPISRIFLSGPAKYARAYVYTETDNGDLTYFIHYHLHVIRRAIRDLHAYLARQQKELREAERLMKSYQGLNHRQMEVIYEAIKNHECAFTIAQHAGKHNVTKATARNDLLDLYENGLLEKHLVGRKWVFAPASNVVKRVRRSFSDANQPLKPRDQLG